MSVVSAQLCVRSLWFRAHETRRARKAAGAGASGHRPSRPGDREGCELMPSPYAARDRSHPGFLVRDPEIPAAGRK